MGKREEESMEEVRWETLFLNRPVRVLLVEGDDSTRQIITALLRKCGYKVLSVSDGLKAWEAITGKGCHVDLVLTEVELPSLSGFGLLTMIMEHETCKNIPVIMMSSHDSVSVVFKCMLRGAADYLVKPIRKNELRNLWQHVWRRHLTSGEHAGAQRNQDEKLMNGELGANIENNASNYSSEYVDCVDKNDGNTAKGSEVQSSCTRSDTEAESKYMKHVQETKQPMSKSLILLDTKMTPNGDEHDAVSMKHAIAEAEDNSVTLGPECNSSEVLADNGSSAVAAMNEDFKVDFVDIDDATNETKSKEAIDLIGAMDNQRDGTNVAEDHPVHDLLELSLRRTTQACSQKQENNEPKTLNHSNSSPFSLYTSRTPLPPSTIPMKLITETEKLLSSSSMKSQVIQVSSNMCERERSNSVEDTNPSGSATTNQDETSLHLSLRAIPFPVPITWQANGSLLQPMFTSQSSNSFLSAMPPIWKEASHPNSADEVDPMQSEQLPTYHSAENKEEIAEIRDEQIDVSTTIVDSSNSNNINAEVGKNEVPFVHDGMRQMDFLRMNQREAALTKYRLKRKDRCYEKKVRYQSRKLLAEQRPRVKGQFVRQIQHYSSDSVTG